MKWLEGLLREINSSTELTDSDEELTAGYREICELPEEIKKVFSYCMALSSKMRDLRKDIEETDSKKTEQDLRTGLLRLGERAQIASSIMWAEIKNTVLRDHPDRASSLSICKGFKLRTMDPAKAIDLSMKKMFGA